MNKKLFGLLAASAAVVSSAIFAAPARAVQQEVGVNLTVDEVLFLRTFQTIELKVSQGELSGGNGIDKDYNSEPTTDGTGLINTDDVPNLDQITGGSTVPKTVQELYAVWGNGDVANVTVTIKPTPGGEILDNGAAPNTQEYVKATMSVTNDQLDSERTFDDFTGPLKVGGVQLQFDFARANDTPVSPRAGRYTGGMLTVEATAVQQQ